jgi:hypothetical protein
VPVKEAQQSGARQTQIEAQRSGFDLERRSKGAEHSFKAAPKGTALKRSGADFTPTCLSLTKKMHRKILVLQRFPAFWNAFRKNGSQISLT